MSDGERREIERSVTGSRLGPVEQAGHRDTVDEHMLDVEVAVDEHRTPWAEHGSRTRAVALDRVGREDPVRDEPVALLVE